MSDEETVGLILGTIGSVFLGVVIVQGFWIYHQVRTRAKVWNLAGAMQVDEGTVTFNEWKSTYTAGNPDSIRDEEVLTLLTRRPYNVIQPPSMDEENREEKMRVWKNALDKQIIVESHEAARKTIMDAQSRQLRSGMRIPQREIIFGEVPSERIPYPEEGGSWRETSWSLGINNNINFFCIFTKSLMARQDMKKRGFFGL